jgi:hypothetical protein
MDGVGTLAQFLTLIFTMIIAAGGAVAVVKVWLPGKRTAEQTKQQTIEIHQIVNQQRTDMQRYQAVLVQALHQHGITVPQDQSTIDTTKPPSETP